MKKQLSYIDSVHRSGTIWNISVMILLLAFPLTVAALFGAAPDWGALVVGLIATAPMYWAVGVIETITFVPMLGAGGSYLSFVTGNISNLKLPCAINALEQNNVSANSEEGEVISTIAIATSSIVTTVIIIIGAAMDAMRVDSWTRMMYLMLILGFLGWPGIARLVRGQILSLREQEFMTAAEACGISAWHRIFRHLIPNVIPQLIVTCTMSLGSTILTEATLSFLGLGVKYPFASWGNIINDVNNAYVMTNYLFIWVPAGICLLITVLGFNFVGDGLRDAFDPKMKR